MAPEQKARDTERNENKKMVVPPTLEFGTPHVRSALADSQQTAERERGYVGIMSTPPFWCTQFKLMSISGSFSANFLSYKVI